MEIKHKGIAYDLEVVSVHRGYSVLLEAQTENKNKRFNVSISGDLSEEEWDDIVYEETLEVLPNYAGGYMEEINEWAFNIEVSAIVSEVVKRALEEREKDCPIQIQVDVTFDNKLKIEAKEMTLLPSWATTFEGYSYEEIYNKLYN